MQRDAAQLLGQPQLRVLKGGGGEFEHHPTKDIVLHGLQDGMPWEGSTGISWPGTRRLCETDATLSDVWFGSVEDAFATSIVTSTAALALEALGHADPVHSAHQLWQRRHHVKAA
jgi:hypothetical protein